MIIDARTLPAEKMIETTVCVIGGGVAGLALAREVIGRDIDVCILESGGLDREPEVQTLAAGDNAGLR